jgi:hypothetical protein
MSTPPNAEEAMAFVMSVVAHDALLRPSELLQLQHQHAVYDTATSTWALTIETSKANQTGPPEHVSLANYGPRSGAALLKIYLDAFEFQTRTPTAPLFPRHPLNMPDAPCPRACFAPC